MNFLEGKRGMSGDEWRCSTSICTHEDDFFCSFGGEKEDAKVEIPVVRWRERLFYVYGFDLVKGRRENFDVIA